MDNDDDEDVTTRECASRRKNGYEKIVTNHLSNAPFPNGQRWQDVDIRHITFHQQLVAADENCPAFVSIYHDHLGDAPHCCSL